MSSCCWCSKVERKESRSTMSHPRLCHTRARVPRGRAKKGWAGHRESIGGNLFVCVRKSETVAVSRSPTRMKRIFKRIAIEGRPSNALHALKNRSIVRFLIKGEGDR